jgi:WD40 repeat protein
MLRFLVRLSGVIVCLLCVVMSVATAPRVETTAQPQQREGAFREVLRYGRGVPTGVQWQPNGDIILVNSISGLWLYTDTLTDLHHFPDLRDAWFSPDGQWILGKENDKSAIYDAASFERIKQFDTFYFFNFSPDNRYLWYADEEEGVVVLQTADLTPASPIPFSDKAKSIHWSDNEKYLAVVYGEEMEIWEVEPQGLKYTLPHYQDSFLHWSPDGTRLLIDHPDNTLELLEGATGELIKAIPADERFPSKPSSDSPMDVGYFDLIVWKPDSSEFLRYYPSNSLGAIHVFSDRGVSLHEILSDQISYVSFTRDSQFLTSSVGVFETTNYTRVGQFFGFNVTRSPDNHFVTTDTMFGADVFMFDLKSGQSQVLNTKGETHHVVWSPTGDRFITAGKGLIEIWDTLTQKVLYQHDQHFDYKAARFSHTGEMVAVSEFGGTLRVFDTRTGELLSILPGSDFPVSSWEWQPYGNLLATSYGDLTAGFPDDGSNVYLWDAQNGRLIDRVNHRAMITELGWSPDGNFLLIGGYGSTIQLADAYTHRRYALTDLGRIEFPSFNWSSDGKILWVVYRAGTHGGTGIKFWNRETNRSAAGNFGFTPLASYVWNTRHNVLLLSKTYCDDRVPPYLCSVRSVVASRNPLNVGGSFVNYNDVFDTPAFFTVSGLPDEAHMYWSSDGSRLIVQSDDWLQVWDAEAQKQAFTVFGVSHATWSANNFYILIEYQDKRVEILDVKANKILSRFSNVDYAKWMDDGKTIMVRRGEYPEPMEYEYYNILTGERLIEFPNLDVTMSADGNTFIHFQGGIITLWSRE